MTPDDLKLCRDIARAEGFEISRDGKWYLREKWTDVKIPIHRYLTDPAEQCRMQEALQRKIVKFKGGYINKYYFEFDEEDQVFEITTFDDYGSVDVSHGADLMRVRAEAFLHMLRGDQ